MDEEVQTSLDYRGLVAYVLMALLVIVPSVGLTDQFGTGYGLTWFGMACGLVGYLLGKE